MTSAGQSTAGAAALDLLRRGRYPLPLPFRTKAPIDEGWQKSRITAADVPARFPPNQRLNVGALTGEPSGGVHTVDIDCPEALALADHVLPATASEHGRTGAPRSHRDYRLSAPLKTEPFSDPTHAKTDGGKAGMLVEILGTGRQVVMPPSVHPSGELYEWQTAGEPAEVDGPDLRRRVATLAGLALLARHWPDTESHTRHYAALALAGGLIRGGIHPDNAGELIRLVSWAAGDEESGKRAKDAVSTAERLRNDETATGWPKLAEFIPPKVLDRVRAWLGITPERPVMRPAETDTPVPPFPLETLPAVLRALVEASTASLPAPADMVALPLLTALGAAIGDAYELEIKPGWREAANLSTCVVGDPGSKKSPAQNVALAPLHRIQAELARQHRDADSNYQDELAAWEALPKRSRGRKPDPPAFRHVVTTDATVEALAPMLLDSKGVLLWREELAGWVRAMDQYRGGKGADRQHYLSMWGRALIKIDRKGAPPVIVPHPFLSITGGIQPDLLPELGDSAGREDGFLDRLLWSYPETAPDYWTTASISAETLSATETLFGALYNLDSDRDDRGQPVPHIVRFSDGAAKTWGQWYADHSAEVAALAFNPRLKGPWAKMPAQAARLALILHLAAPATAPQITDVTLGDALDLIDYFKAHARRVYDELRAAKQGLPLRLLTALKEHGEMSQSDLQTRVLRGNVPIARIIAALGELEEAGLVRQRQGESNGGRAPTLWSAT